eukprot:scaffold8739_cov173-Ochromonas_danica.AAC.6
MLLWYLFVAVLLIVRIVSREYIDDYAVVIDAGSTGSRCFVFHVIIDIHAHRNITSHPCGKVVPGLSSFSSHPSDVVEYIAPLLQIAASRIPADHHSRTTVFIKATAGMRLLPEVRQSIIWHHLLEGLNRRTDIPFIIPADRLGTIDGHAEAFYAVLASNYIAGSIDGNLHPVDDMPLLGALDMGGSSTQLIFYNGTLDGHKVHADDFWSHSWLNYGVVRVHERVLDYIQAEHIHASLARSMDNMTRAINEASIDLDVGGEAILVEDILESGRCGEVIIPNPCGFLNHRFLRGESEQCIDIIEKVIWPNDNNLRKDRGKRGAPIDEIEHPEVHGHHFYAMSVYYYALDCMRELGPMDLEFWPAPSLDEIESAAMTFCGMEWSSLYEAFQGPAKHPWTATDQLQDRCFEVLYIITLLEKGFGFDRHGRSITFALEVGGKEVEWTLGFALAEIDFSPMLVAQSEFDYQQQRAERNLLRIFFAPLRKLASATDKVLIMLLQLMQRSREAFVGWIGWLTRPLSS